MMALAILSQDEVKPTTSFIVKLFRPRFLSLGEVIVPKIIETSVDLALNIIPSLVLS